MAGKPELFIIMFRAEIENSIEDAISLEGLYAGRFKSKEISGHVYNENEAFLAREIAGLKELLKFLESFDPARFSRVEDIANEAGSMIKKKVADYEDPEAVYAIVSRKIKKILTYLNLWD
ncbi:MAG: hypothetical protein LBU18_07765 [Treponema sp.]|jgi:hypothetical protein|nr:hypothetical protein [Treponema sp.]